MSGYSTNGVLGPEIDPSQGDTRLILHKIIFNTDTTINKNMLNVLLYITFINSY